MAGEQTRVGERQQGQFLFPCPARTPPRAPFGSLPAPGLYTLFFSDFPHLPLVFPLLREVCLALVGQANPVSNRKGTEVWLQADPRGEVQEGQAHVISLFRYFPASSYFQKFVSLGAPKGSLFSILVFYSLRPDVSIGDTGS